MASGERQAQAWDLGAKGWAENQELYSLPHAEWLLDHLTNGRLKNGQDYQSGYFRLLDAGCGPGAAVRLAWEKGVHASGTDVSEEMLKIARERTPHAEFVCADSESLPFPDEHFDAVMAVNSLQFTETPANALREFMRITKRDGRIGLVVFGALEKNDMVRTGAAMRKLLQNPPNMEGPFSLSPEGKLECVMEEADFKVETEEQFDYYREYRNAEEFWKGQLGSGPVRFAIKELGQEAAKRGVYSSVEPLLRPDGSFTMRYHFRGIIGRSKL